MFSSQHYFHTQLGRFKELVEATEGELYLRLRPLVHFATPAAVVRNSCQHLCAIKAFTDPDNDGPSTRICTVTEFNRSYNFARSVSFESTVYHHRTHKTAPFTDDDDNTPISTNHDGNITLMS